VLRGCPLRLHTILTDNGSDFAKDFAAAAAARGLEHRHTRPRRPQTNGMVERYNGMLKEALGVHDGAWWHQPSDRPTDRDRFHQERFGTPLPDRAVARMQAAVDRWLLWLNAVRPNRQLAWQTPLRWLQGLEADLPSRFQRPTATMVSPARLHQIAVGLRGQRFLLAPPPDWLRGAGLSGTT
jgi:transposase InsO family protein